MFIATPNGPAGLSDLSPAISSSFITTEVNGVTYTAPAKDIQGVQRPNPTGTTPDMGAFESDKGVDPNYAGPKWYVDGPANVPYANGGPGAPFVTIQEALNASADNDTIIVANGTYTESIQLNGKKIAIIGEDRDSTIISAGVNGYGIYLNQAGKPNTLIRNITITNGAAENGNAGLYVSDNSPNCKFENLNIIGNNGDGVYIAGFSSGKFSNCIIADNGLNGLIIWSESDAELVNATIVNNGQYGINIQGDGLPKNITVSTLFCMEIRMVPLFPMVMQMM